MPSTVRSTRHSPCIWLVALQFSLQRIHLTCMLQHLSFILSSSFWSLIILVPRRVSNILVACIPFALVATLELNNRSPSKFSSNRLSLRGNSNVQSTLRLESCATFMTVCSSPQAVWVLFIWMNSSQESGRTLLLISISGEDLQPTEFSEWNRNCGLVVVKFTSSLSQICLLFLSHEFSEIHSFQGSWSETGVAS